MMNQINKTKQLLAAVITMMAAIVVPAATHAQTHYRPHVDIGVHAGMDMSKVTFSPSVDQGWLPGPTLGVSFGYAEERLVGIRAELNYSQRGWKEKFEDSPLSYSRQLHYLSLPLMTHIYFGSKRTKCFFNLGPEFSFLIAQHTSSNFDIDNPESAEGWPEVKRMTEQLTTQVKNRFDYGICAGVGCEYYLQPRNSAYLELRYYYGLGNIFPSSKADTFSASRNMALSLTLGYNFRLQ